MDIILASASPRRRELLAQIGIQAQVMPVDADERLLPNERAEDYVQRVAQDKAQLCPAYQRADVLVIAADTAVAVDQQIFGKPQDYDDFCRMHAQLSGRWHQVHSGVVLARAGRIQACAQVTTRVQFAAPSDAQLRAYWHSAEPCDKAGGYAIQGKGARFVQAIEGCYFNVVGLPLAKISNMLIEAGYIFNE